MRKITSLLLVVLFGLSVAGCAGKKSVQESVEVEDGSAVSTVGLDEGGSTFGEGLDGMGSYGGDGDPLSKRVVYFEYDSSMLTPEGEMIVQAHAAYLGSNTGIQVVLEGHADERGTREYNLALGEDRARSVARVMEAYGVGGNRIQNISFGEERPVALGHDESAWSMNRRVEILY